MKFSFFTATIDREIYLKRCLDSLWKNIGNEPDYEHQIAFIGNKPSDSFLDFLNGLPSDYTNKIILHHWNQVIQIGAAVTKIRNLCSGEWFCKLDDDCIIRSPDYLTHISEIINLKKYCSFSGFPVGLIGNFGGVQSTDREVVYSKKTDTYYTLRKVPHVGGFGRIIPMDVLRKIPLNLTGHSDDTEMSEYCRKINVPMYYLENAIIIEHCESTLGQKERFKK